MALGLLRWVPAVKTALRGIFFRQRWYGDDHHSLERMYQSLEDPWNFQSSPYERERMSILIQTIHRYPHDSVLEVGCSEGLFTCELSALSHRIVAIDVSATAIARARERCATPVYTQSSLEDYHSDEVFDMVICAETLYYIRDVERSIRKLSELGRYCLVSYLERESKNLDSYFVTMPLREFTRYEIPLGVLKRSMTVVVWRNDT